MSIHARNPELEARLQAQRRNSTVASLIIGLLLISLLALIFWAIGVTVFNKTTDPIVAYNSSEPVEDTIEKVKITSQVTKTPTQSASSSAVKVITASAAVSSYSVPSPDEAVESLSLDFGTNEGFGQGWAGADSGFASGGAGGSFSFMGSKMKGDRVCFVMDYSRSMNKDGGIRINLLKSELLKTVESLENGMNFELIFFAGPAWLSGSVVSDPTAKKFSTVMDGNQKYEWICHQVSDWEYKIPRQNGEWEILNDSTRRMNLDSIRDTPLVWGTDWKTPLAMALEMKPAPDLVVFLTDGLCGANSMSIAEDMGTKAKNLGVQINTIALMEPRARDAMAKLATSTGGTFALIDQAGNKVDQPMAK